VLGVTVADFGLGTQAWWGAEPYDPDRVHPVRWPNQPIEKPQHGFFTSSWDGQTSAWIEYQGRTERAAEPRRVQLFFPRPDARLYVVASSDDYELLAEQYPQRYENPKRSPLPDWHSLASEGPFDAIHMTAAALSDTSLWYAHSWAVESTLWFRPKLTLLDPS
jgi:hypothetical protein